MRAAFDYAARLHVIDAISGNDVGKAVGNDNDALGLGKLADVLQNHGFAFYINVARCFVKNINVFVGNKVYRQSQTLPLSAGKIGGVLGNDLVQPAVLPQKICQIDLLQGGVDFRVSDIGLGKAEVCPHGFVKNVGVVADHRKAGIVGRAGNAFQPFAAHCDRARRRAQRTGQQVYHRGFAAAGLAHKGGHTAAREGHGHVFQNLPLAVVGEADVLQRQLGVGDRLLTPDGVGLLQKRQNFLPGRNTVHGNVERRAERAQRQKKVHRYQNQEQRRNRGDCPLCDRTQRHSNAQPRAAVGNQIHNGRAGKLHDQNLHCDFTKRLAGFVHFAVLRGIGTENFQLLQALHTVQKGVAHRGVLPPILGKNFLCPSGNRHNGQWDQRHAAQKHQRHLPRDAHGNAEQQKRRKYGVKELRQVGGIVQIQLLHALHGNLGQARHAHIVGGAHAEAHDFVVDALPQVLFDAAPQRVLQVADKAGAEIAHRQARTGADRRCRKDGCAAVKPQGECDAPTQRCGDAHIGKQPQHHPAYAEADVLFAAAEQPQKIFVDHDLPPQIPFGIAENGML